MDEGYARFVFSLVKVMRAIHQLATPQPLSGNAMSDVKAVFIESFQPQGHADEPCMSALAAVMKDVPYWKDALSSFLETHEDVLSKS